MRIFSVRIISFGTEHMYNETNANKTQICNVR